MRQPRVAGAIVEDRTHERLSFAARVGSVASPGWGAITGVAPSAPRRWSSHRCRIPGRRRWPALLAWIALEARPASRRHDHVLENVDARSPPAAAPRSLAVHNGPCSSGTTSTSSASRSELRAWKVRRLPNPVRGGMSDVASDLGAAGGVARFCRSGGGRFSRPDRYDHIVSIVEGARWHRTMSPVAPGLVVRSGWGLYPGYLVVAFPLLSVPFQRAMLKTPGSPTAAHSQFFAAGNNLHLIGTGLGAPVIHPLLERRLPTRRLFTRRVRVALITATPKTAVELVPLCSRPPE